jgi:hypothetical protein
MKKDKVIISSDAEDRDYPEAVILTEKDALELYNAKTGEKVECSSPNVDYVVVGDGFFEFHGQDYGTIKFDKQFVKLVIDKSYYVGQKLKSNKPYQIR